ncbi:MAG: PTS sugar transporter subunit IIC [Elusimicrobiales bacterium]
MTHGFVYSAIVSLINLDTTSFLQSSISRPSASGLILGFLTGHAFEGFILGIIFELVILDFPPIGGMPVPNGCIAVGISCYLVSIADAGFSFFAGLIGGILYSYVEMILRSRRKIFNRAVEKSILSFRFSVGRFVFLSLMIEFLVALIYVYSFSLCLKWFFSKLSLDLSYRVKQWLELSLISTVFITLTSMVFKFLTQVRKNA